MKRILLTFVAIFLFGLTCSAQQYYDYRDRYLPSRSRTETTLHVIFPMYAGLSTMIDVNGSELLPDISRSDLQDMLTGRSFLFSMELAHLSFTSKGTPFEADLGLRWSYLNKRNYMNASYIGVPLRVGVKVGRQSKIFAGADAEVFLRGSASDPSLVYFPYRLAAEAGISFGFLGIWASYGLTPLFQSATDTRMLTFGIVIEA